MNTFDSNFHLVPEHLYEKTRTLFRAYIKWLELAQYAGITSCRTHFGDQDINIILTEAKNLYTEVLSNPHEYSHPLMHEFLIQNIVAIATKVGQVPPSPQEELVARAVNQINVMEEMA